MPSAVEQPAARPVARAVQELLHAPQVQVAEQRLAHPVSSSILKLRTPATLRGTFHSICRAITSVLAAVSLIGTVTSQADLP